MRVYKMLALGCLLCGVAWGAGFTETAAADRSDCPSGYICLWDGSTFGQDRAQFHDNGWQNLSGFGFNDRMSSFWNNTNRWGEISTDAGGGGDRLCIPPGSWLGPLAARWDNKASAVRLIASGGC